MLRLDLTLPTLAENLALDEALLIEAEAGGPSVLRFWEWNHLAVIVGAGGKIVDEAEREACLRDGVPILRRSSGGGTVLLGPGCLLYSLILRYDDWPALSDLHASYRFIGARMSAALSPDAATDGTSDLVLAGRKFSGNAQQRKLSTSAGSDGMSSIRRGCRSTATIVATNRSSAICRWIPLTFEANCRTLGKLSTP